MTDILTLEVGNLVAQVHTGIYSEETGRPQPLRISVRATMTPLKHHTPDSSLGASFDYMHIKQAATTEIETAGHFQLIEAVADHICASLFKREPCLQTITVTIVKTALSVHNEEIGITLKRRR